MTRPSTGLDYCSDGGIDGRPIEIEICDDKDDPQQAQQCADKLINQEQVIAMFGAYGRQTSTLYPAMAARNVPLFANAPSAPEDFENELSYPFMPGRLAWFNAGLAAEGEDWKKVAVVNYTTAQPNYDFAVTGFKQVGINDVVEIEADPTTVDWTPIATQLKQANVDAFTAPLADAQIGLLLQAAADVGVKVPVIVQSGTLSPRVIDAAEKAGIRLRVIHTYVLDPEKSERRADMLKDFEAYEDKITDTYQDAVVNAWLGPVIFAEAANNGDIEDLTPEGVKAWLDKQTALDTGMSALLDFTKPGPVAEAPRVVNVSMMASEVQDGKFNYLNDEFTSLAP